MVFHYLVTQNRVRARKNAVLDTSGRRIQWRFEYTIGAKPTCATGAPTQPIT